ncbi:DUF99 family protein [Infirmifilum lucidum]|uniref:UPF0215 protein IG193_06295 n=1 Tax=Infirmifilum lucidum TaxID=2776706 RepID=A0A7L9FHH5_9CREN|nr:DUF99 family protein [Infirmifilum lucidum]QOJ78364.1 DUF99 family protein [Infirmifilum lucidum]
MQFTKPAFRVLGMAECFNKKLRKSILAAVSYRRDGIVDGVYLTWLTVGGLDATEKIVELVRNTGRQDINAVMLNGCIISWFNIVDIKTLYRELGIPVVCLSYEESSGLEKFLEKYFPGDEGRLKMYSNLGERRLVYISSSRSYVYARYEGIGEEDLRELLNAVTKHGKVPEPLRIAQSIARAIYLFLEENDPSFLQK